MLKEITDKLTFEELECLVKNYGTLSSIYSQRKPKRDFPYKVGDCLFIKSSDYQYIVIVRLIDLNKRNVIFDEIEIDVDDNNVNRYDQIKENIDEFMYKAEKFYTIKKIDRITVFDKADTLCDIVDKNINNIYRKLIEDLLELTK